MTTPTDRTALTEASCRGVVRAVDGARISVALDPAGQCDACATRGRCAWAGSADHLLMLDAAGFQPGDRVRVYPGTPPALSAWALIAISVVLVLAGSFAGYSAAEILVPGQGETGSVLGIAGGLLLSYGGVHLLGRLRPGHPPRIERLD